MLAKSLPVTIGVLLFAFLFASNNVRFAQAKTAAPVITSIESKKESKYFTEGIGEQLEHDLTVQSGKFGQFDLFEELVQGCLVHLKLSSGGKVVFEKELPRWEGLCEPHFAVIDPTVEGPVDAKPVARDINKDGLPELILLKIYEGSSTSADECFIYQLSGDKVREIYRTTQVQPHFKDIDGDGAFEMIVTDTNFVGWNGAANCEGGNGKVVLSWDGTTYMPSAKLMAKPAPTAQSMQKLVKTLQPKVKTLSSKCRPGTKGISAAVWKEMVGLVYDGNGKSAQSLLEELYPGNTKLVLANPDGIPTGKPMTRHQFWSTFVSQMGKSSFAATLKQLNPQLTTSAPRT
jgi:hypothetical protein